MKTLVRQLSVITLFCVGLISTAGQVDAKEFENSYVSMWLPDDWQCDLEGTEWVCRPPTKPYPMIVIMAAKEVGATDTAQLYFDHLVQLPDPPKIKVLSPAAYRLFQRRLWIDATMLGSEIKGYATRYLGRVEGKIGVLITFSAHETKREEGDEIAERIADSLRIKPKFALRQFDDF